MNNESFLPVTTVGHGNKEWDRVEGGQERVGRRENGGNASQWVGRQVPQLFKRSQPGMPVMDVSLYTTPIPAV